MRTKTEKTHIKGFYFREEDHKYFLDGKPMTGVTTILGVLNKHLEAWAARRSTEYIQEFAEKKNGLYLVSDELLNLAKTAYAKFALKRANEGTNMHSLVETYVRQCIEQEGGLPILPSQEEKIQPFIDWCRREGIKFIASEKKFYSISMFVAGTADLIFEKDGKRYMGDVKNKKKIWDRTPFFQCAAYTLLAEEMGEPVFSGYCIIKLWENEVEPLWSFDVEGDRAAFKACVTIYRQLANWTTKK